MVAAMPWRAMSCDRKRRNSYLRSERPPVAAVGVENLVVVATADAVLVGRREATQDVKKIVEQLRGQGPRPSHPSRGGAPALGQLRKRGQRRALPGQAHHRQAGAPSCRCRCTITAPSTGSWCRAPRWSPATKRQYPLPGNQSTYIPLGARHRLENPGKIPLHLIEVQSGRLSRRGRYRPLRGQLRSELALRRNGPPLHLRPRAGALGDQTIVLDAPVLLRN